MVQPIRRLVAQTIDVFAVLRGLFCRGTISEQVAQAYREHVIENHSLQELPDDAVGPRFVINAANLQSGALWRFSKPYLADWRVEMIPQPRTDLAVAVAASSAFPPILWPTILRFEESAYAPNSGADLQRPPYTTRVMLTDGGVYDNLGLETAWKCYRTILVGDGGAQMEPRPGRDSTRHTRRVIGMIDNQVRSLRKRRVIASYTLLENVPGHRFGAYWSIRSNIADYPAPGTLPCPHVATMRLAAIPTRLAHLSDITQMRLINWGYASCNAAMRAYVDRSMPAPTDFPYPSVGVG